MDYPERSINSMMNCGNPTGYFVIKECHCNTEAISLHYHCDLRVCPVCSKRRKGRIFSRFIPFFKRYRVTRSDFFQFITISPPNYDNLEKGQEHIRKSFAKFIRRKYVKERIKAGFYVLETKQNPENGKWNIHLHAVIYGRWLDYRIRGHCLDCGQNLLRYNKAEKKFYCANRKCNSKNIIRRDDTRLGLEWKASSGDVAHIYGERVRNTYGAVSYLTKYISNNKDNFLSEKSLAEYIFYTRKRKLINAFGKFFLDIRKGKMPKPVFNCPNCGSEIKFWFDIEVSWIIWKAQNKPPDPPDLNFWIEN